MTLNKTAKVQNQKISGLEADIQVAIAKQKGLQDRVQAEKDLSAGSREQLMGSGRSLKSY